MKKPTLAQANQVLNLIAQKQMPAEQLQNLLESGLLSDLLDGNVGEVDREKFRRVLGLNPLVMKTVEGSDILLIDRTKPFDPEKFIGKGWSIWKGLADGDGLLGLTDEDEHSLALTEVDLRKVFLESFLKRGENVISGEENLVRAKAAGHIRLDAKVFQTIWESKHLIPKSWRKKGYVFFDGTVLRNPVGHRYVLYLDLSGGQWHWTSVWQGYSREIDRPSAALVS